MSFCSGHKKVSVIKGGCFNGVVVWWGTSLNKTIYPSTATVELFSPKHHVRKRHGAKGDTKGFNLQNYCARSLSAL